MPMAKDVIVLKVQTRQLVSVLVRLMVLVMGKDLMLIQVRQEQEMEEMEEDPGYLAALVQEGIVMEAH